jgi:hypothetical protein
LRIIAHALKKHTKAAGFPFQSLARGIFWKHHPGWQPAEYQIFTLVKYSRSVKFSWVGVRFEEMSMKVRVAGFAAAALLGAALFTGSASAAPMMGSGVAAGGATSETLIVQVQRRSNFGGRGVARGGRGIGAAGAAAIGIGILGAAAAANAAQCYERQPVVNRWGEIVGYRRIYVC